MLGQSEAIREYQPKFPVLYAILVGLFCLLALRLAYLQLYRGGFYYRFSQQNSLRKEKLPGPRGQIFDRDQRLLVDNRLQLDVTVTPQFIKDPPQTLGLLASLAGEPVEPILNDYRNRSKGAPKFQPITLIQNIPWETVVKIERSRAQLGGVNVESRIRRTYLQGTSGAHLLGYLSEVTKKDLEKHKNLGGSYEIGDWIGRFGLESKWEKYLRGRDGVRFVVVDAHGHRISESTSNEPGLSGFEKNIEPEPGLNLVLTLDADLQQTIQEAMKGKMGSVVALDPRTGEVLAMHSQPSFDPTEMASKGPELWSSFYNNPYGPLRNKAVQDHFPPGSTFKVFSGLAGLEAGILDPSTKVFCPGFYRFGRRVYSCHKKEGHGYVDLKSAISGSCDVYFWSLASRISIDKISEMGTYFGLGRKTGIDLSHERPGLMPTEEWKQKAYKEVWNPGETLSASIGQGYTLVTPLQLAVSYATLVNGGNLYRPYVLSRIETIQGEVIERFGPELLGNHNINPDYLAKIKEGLEAVVNAPGGTGYNAVRSKDVIIGGKSGTVQVINFASREEAYRPCHELPFEKRHHAWFVGYAPASRVAGPVVKAVIEKWNQKKMLKEFGPKPASATVPGAEVQGR